MKKIVLIIIVVLIGGFLLIQLVPVPHTNPPVVTQLQWDSPQTQALAQRACMDCHSNETVWPWYSRVAPVSWLVAFDVFRGRRQLNFSELNANPSRLSRMQERIGRIIEEGEMPPSQYLVLHPDANLTPEERQLLAVGMQKTLSQTLANK